MDTAMDAEGGAGLPGVREAVTGDPRVDEAITRLGDLAGTPVADHADVFEYVHQRLADALGDLDAREGAAAGDRPPRGPGR